MLEVDIVRLALGPLFLIGFLIIKRLGKNVSGRVLKLIGVLHVLGGAVVGRGSLARIFREGFFGEADSGLGHLPEHADKEMVFWFMLWGVYAFILGQAVSWIEGRGERPPASVGWTVAASSLLSIALYPKGGFWLVLIPAYLIVRRARPAAP